ncbi:MAG: hypothetical protein ABW096_04055 [Candidatus Thiodiazotropha sp.]
MNSRKTYTLESSIKLFNSKQGYYSLVGTWLVLLLWAYQQSSYTVLVGPLVITIIILLAATKYFKKKIDIVITDDTLSIHEGDATLWVTLLRDITSIDYEKKSLFQLGARKAMIIRNSKKDSYYLALDGMSFKKLDNEEVINELKSLYSNNA